MQACLLKAKIKQREGTEGGDEIDDLSFGFNINTTFDEKEVTSGYFFQQENACQLFSG